MYFIYEWVNDSRSVMSNSLWPHALKPTRLLCPWDSPGKNTDMGWHSLLQNRSGLEIFLITFLKYSLCYLYSKTEIILGEDLETQHFIIANLFWNWYKINNIRPVSKSLIDLTNTYWMILCNRLCSRCYKTITNMIDRTMTSFI